MSTPSRREELYLGLAGLLAAAAVPVILFWDLLGDVAATFEPSLNWLLTGASGFALIFAGVAAVTPVVLSHRADPGQPPLPAQPRGARGLGREPLPDGRDAAGADRGDREYVVVPPLVNSLHGAIS